MDNISLKLSIGALTVFILTLTTGCGPSLNDAKQLGFDSVEEMKTAKKNGLNTKAELNDADAKKAGFARPSRKNSTT